MKNSVKTCALAALVAMTASGAAAQSSRPTFAIGADVSWMQRIEADKYPTYYVGETVDASQVTTIPEMMDAAGMNAVRLRVWVNPSEALAKNGFTATVDGTTWTSSPTYGYCSAADMVQVAKRLVKDGRRLMVCFQLSDTWADPGRQYIPAAWSGCTTTDELSVKVCDHITSTLEQLRDAGITPTWVQIGNETSTGMLKCKMPTADGQRLSTVAWGCAVGDINAQQEATTANFVKVWSAAARAARNVCPEVATVMHLAEGHDVAKLHWVLDLLTKAGFDSSVCDYVGLSLYPCADDRTAQWLTDASACVSAIGTIYERYGMRTVLCEIGMNNEWSESTPASAVAELGSQAANIAQCDADVRAFTEYLFAELAEKASTCDGLFYWEPEVDYLDNYTKGACHSITPGPAWARDKVTANPFWSVCAAQSASVEAVDADDSGERRYYDLRGVRVSAPGEGVFIEVGAGGARKIMK